MAKVTPKKKQSAAVGCAAAIGASLMGRGDRIALEELEKTRDTIADINNSRAAISLDKRAGTVFEEFHAGTFNANAAKAGKTTLKATTGAASGFANDQRVDIRISDGGKTIAEVQAKCCKSAGRSAVAVSKPQYQGTQRVIPSDQVGEASIALKRSAAAKARSSNPRMRGIGEARSEAAEKLTSQIKAKGVASDPLTHAEAQSLAAGKMEKLDTLVQKQATSAALNEIGRSATTGMAMTAGFGIVTGIHGIATGNCTVEEAVGRIVVDSAKAGARGAATAGATQVVRATATAALSKGTATALLRGSAPAAIAAGLVDLGVDAINGDLTAEKAAKTVGRTACGWAGAEGGAAIGTLICPGIGTVVGGLLGGLLGASLF